MDSITQETPNGCIRVAFATTNLEDIDSHFGSAKRFYVFDVSKEEHSAVKIIEIKEKDTDVTVSSLAGVDIVYFVDIGPAAAAKLINSGIFPIKYKEIIKIEDELNKLTKMLGTNPPPFIKKIIEKKAA
ncbi:MAG: NifB/NifX family molybdenum-iron cluster-binding protein [Arcobacteraceae bacterium]|nr:NifB/NifX family molybdenum-iron cluster-binding protein [Arcobacteraceae bacterium]